MQYILTVTDQITYLARWPAAARAPFEAASPAFATTAAFSAARRNGATAFVAASL